MRYFATTATLSALMLGSTALAGPVDDIVSQFQSYGYESIEIRQEGDLVKIEGVRDGIGREIVYDLNTTTIIKDETGPAGDDEDDGKGTEMDDETDDEQDDEHDDEQDDEHDDQADDENDDGEDDNEDDGGDDEGDDNEDDD